MMKTIGIALVKRHLCLACIVLAAALLGCDVQNTEQPAATTPSAPPPAATPKASPAEAHLKKRFPLNQIHSIFREIGALEDKAEADAEADAEKKAPLGELLPSDWDQARKSEEMLRRTKVHTKMVEDYRARYAKRHRLSYDEMLAVTKIGMDEHW